MKIALLFTLLLLTGCSSTGNQEQQSAVTDLPKPSSLKTFVYNQDGKGYWVDIALTDL
ncbi:MAG: hypothetical protein GY951_13545 [Psychromonas sp.]|nr:hypothetical protein [Alteromonadales bacterium]MCP5079065.1 hypothetical protein [Psychromonas sp.]